MSTIEVKVPDIGDFTDVPVIEVLVKPGDTVKAEDSLVTLESDKATMDVPAPAPALPPSSRRIRLPSLTLSPTLTTTSFTVPAEGAGTSIVALSDSSVTSASSAFTASPAFTSTSITGTSLKPPMSGTLTSMTLLIGR